MVTREKKTKANVKNRKRKDIEGETKAEKRKSE